MKTADRIYQAPACPSIQLKDEELDVYKGSGWALAGFKEGKLAKVHYLLSFTPEEGKADEESGCSAALTAAQSFEKDGLELWTGCMSCTEFTDPQQLSTGDPSGLARLMRLVGDELADSM